MGPPHRHAGAAFSISIALGALLARCAGEAAGLADRLEMRVASPRPSSQLVVSDFASVVPASPNARPAELKLSLQADQGADSHVQSDTPTLAPASTTSPGALLSASTNSSSTTLVPFEPSTTVGPEAPIRDSQEVVRLVSITLVALIVALVGFFVNAPAAAGSETKTQQEIEMQGSQ